MAGHRIFRYIKKGVFALTIKKVDVGDRQERISIGNRKNQ